MDHTVYRLLRLEEVLAILRVSRSAFYAGMAAGIYPRPVRIGPRSVRWRFEDVMALRDRGIA
ncbi:helix-turn-helix transcriptional regulator [Aquabacter sediminis]|uniref:helix-turn-helix transcriptional regulator n=1 Tax=Aquabacter sediminis TaxID=3029197 RepID=UPI003CCFE675